MHGHLFLITRRYQWVDVLVPLVRRCHSQQRTGGYHIIASVPGEVFQRRPCGHAFLDLVEEQQRLSGDDSFTIIEGQVVHDLVHVQTVLEYFSDLHVLGEVDLEMALIFGFRESSDDEGLSYLSLSLHQYAFVRAASPCLQGIHDLPSEHVC